MQTRMVWASSGEAGPVGLLRGWSAALGRSPEGLPLVEASLGCS